MKEADFDYLVGLIYESALEPGLWRDTLNVLAQQVGAEFFQLLDGDGTNRATALKITSHGRWDEVLLARLMPHLNRALRLMEHTQAATRNGELAAAGQDAASLSVIAINQSRQMVYCNRNGEALLQAAEVLKICNGILACANEGQQQGLTEILGNISDTGRPANLLLTHRIRPDERYSLTLTPLPRHDGFSPAGEPGGVLCLVVPLDHRRMATAGQLMQLFGLSAAEARLARALAAGETLEFYASESALKLPTVKSQLRAVFEKTATDRQAALVRLIAAIPAVREPD